MIADEESGSLDTYFWLCWEMSLLCFCIIIFCIISYYPEQEQRRIGVLMDWSVVHLHEAEKKPTRPSVTDDGWWYAT